jgi:S1-C subfamily serine protease/peroxiredoxin
MQTIRVIGGSLLVAAVIGACGCGGKSGPGQPAAPSAGSSANPVDIAGPAADPAGGPSSPATNAAQPERPAADVSDVIESVADGIVRIAMLDREGKELGFGSGFVIDASGLVATNFHVVSKAAKAHAEFRDGTKIELNGYRAWDADGDLAIVQLANTPSGMKVLKLQAADDPKLGSAVIAIGHPQGFKFTISNGIVSAVHKGSDVPREYRENLRYAADRVWIQTNAAISGGNSGGPLLSARGEVIGINTWVATGNNLGFAAHARHLADLTGRVQQTTTDLWTIAEPQVQLEKLVGEYVQAWQYFQGRLQQAANVKEQEEIARTASPVPSHAARFFELADKHRDTPAAYQALSFACQIAATDRAPQCSLVLKQACDRILEDYSDSEWLDRIVLAMSASPHEPAWEFMRRLLETTENSDLRGISCYCLASALRLAPEMDAAREAEVLALLDRVCKEFSDVRLGAGQDALGMLAEQQIFHVKFLSIGKVPPEVSGEDSDGIAFRLSDYRGRVVLLDFWADWCPPCVGMYPHERKLVEKQTGKPFALVGVNQDEPDRLNAVMDKAQVTWRSFADGQWGPTAKQWQVTGIPTMFLIDHEGVIRHRFDGALAGPALKELEDAIEKLVSQVPKTDAVADPAAAPTETVDALLGKVLDLQSRQLQLKNQEESAVRRGEEARTKHVEQSVANLRTILDLCGKVLDRKPEPAARERARLAWLQAAEAITSQKGKESADLLSPLDELAAQIVAEQPDSRTANHATFFKISAHLNVERDGSENDPSINRRLFDWTREFAAAFPQDPRVTPLLAEIGRNAEMDGQIGTAEVVYRLLLDLKPNAQLSAQAKNLLKRVSLVGQPFTFGGPTLDGGQVGSADLRGRVVLVTCWMAASPACVGELPGLQQAYDAYHDKGFEIVSVSFDRNKPALDKILAERKLPWPQIYLDDDAKRRSAWTQFSLNAVPATFLLDREGKLVKVGVRGEALGPAIAELLIDGKGSDNK